MISKEDLKRLLEGLETERLEKTESITNTDKFGEAICAFSNDLVANRLPGYLVIGVKDDGTPIGLKVEEKLIQTLLDFRSDGRILPPPLIQVAKFEFEEGEVAVVEVAPSRQPPVRFRGKLCVRVGPRKGVANEAEERILSERRGSFARSFDLLPCEDATIADISIEIFKLVYLPNAIDNETLVANHRETTEQLSSLRFFDIKADRPTYAGILLFGLNPRFFLAGAYVQFVKFEGEDESSPIDFEKRFEGDLATQLRVINDFIAGQIIKRVQSDLGAKYSQNYPTSALQELVFNAIIHRDYQSNAPIRFYQFSNRIEINNPGGLFGDARPENFPNVNDYRNPVLAEATKVLGWVNRFNVGIKRAIAAMERNGNPPLEFRTDQLTSFGVTIPSNG